MYERAGGAHIGEIGSCTTRKQRASCSLGIRPSSCNERGGLIQISHIYVGIVIEQQIRDLQKPPVGSPMQRCPSK